MTEQDKGEPAGRRRRYAERVSREEAAALAAQRALRIVADKGMRALARLLEAAEQADRADIRGRAIVRVLAAVYEGILYPADLVCLRWLDAGQLDDVLAVLRMEGHDFYPTIDQIPHGRTRLFALIERRGLRLEQRIRTEAAEAWFKEENSGDDHGSNSQSDGGRAGT